MTNLAGCVSLHHLQDYQGYHWAITVAFLRVRVISGAVLVVTIAVRGLPGVRVAAAAVTVGFRVVQVVCASSSGGVRVVQGATGVVACGCGARCAPFPGAGAGDGGPRGCGGPGRAADAIGSATAAPLSSNAPSVLRRLVSGRF